MKTLITDPFADDAVSILEWAYGPEAKREFIINTGALGQRTGQAFMNALYTVDPVEYDRLSGSLVDPFYDDTKLAQAIDRLTSKDMDPHFVYHTKDNVYTDRTVCGCDKGENHWDGD